MNTKYKLIFWVPLLFPLSTFAVTADGTLGTTSTGTVDVTITIPALVQISGLSTIALGTPATFPASGSTTACVYSSAGSAVYYLTPSSPNASGGNFRVVNGGVNYITYTATWSSPGATALTPALKVGPFTGDNTSLTCGGTPNATLTVNFSASSVVGAVAGAYADTITLLITPT